MKTGLVLAGGAATGLAHIGLLKAIKEKNIKIDYVVGTSMGAIIASAYALGIDVEHIEEIAKGMSSDKILDPIWKVSMDIAWKLITRKPIIGIYNLNKVEKLLRNEFGNREFKDTNIELGVMATNINNGDKVHFSEGDIVEAVLDSICIPAIFIPKGTNVDGMLRANFPVEIAVEKCDKIIGMYFGYVGSYSGDMTKKSLVHILLQGREISTYEQHFSDIQYAEASGKDIVAIHPEIYNIGSFDFSKSKQIIQKGYEAAMKAL